MKKHFIFDNKKGKDELIVTIPESIAKKVFNNWLLHLKVRRNPKVFPEQPKELAITMQWFGQFIIASQRQNNLRRSREEDVWKQKNTESKMNLKKGTLVVVRFIALLTIL